MSISIVMQVAYNTNTEAVPQHPHYNKVPLYCWTCIFYKSSQVSFLYKMLRNFHCKILGPQVQRSTIHLFTSQICSDSLHDMNPLKNIDCMLSEQKVGKTSSRLENHVCLTFNHVIYTSGLVWSIKCTNDHYLEGTVKKEHTNNTV
jgi:hypothetical protein